MAGPPAPMETDDLEQESRNTAMPGNLRRVSSAPLINIGSISDNTPVYEVPKPPRPRTFSASFSFGNHSSVLGSLLGDSRNSNSTTPVGSPASRVLQIKQEESIDDVTREVTRERDVTSAMQLSRSLDEISWLTDKNFTVTEVKRENTDDIPSAFSSPFIPLSPVHPADNRFSRARSLTPSPGPVPLSPKVRSFTRRSLSPSNLRPSAFTPKRKLDPDDADQYASPCKRLHLCQTSLSTSSASSSSSPDTGSDSVPITSFDDGSCSEESFMYSSTHHSVPIHHHSPLMCDTRHMPFTFVKPKHVAPPSPLAAGSSSASIQVDPRRNSLGATSYTFTPVRD